jgi:hypothetical protein
MLGFPDTPRTTADGSDNEEDWPSIVFLLREAVLPSAEQACEMAKSAWGAAGEVDLLGAVGPHSFAIRIAPLTFALHAFDCCYEADPGPLNPIQERCWDQHRAWLSVDLPGRSVERLRRGGHLSDAYKSLMFFANKHWSANCLALYFPGEQATLPNQGDLIESIRSARRDGIDLDFMRSRKTQ